MKVNNAIISGKVIGKYEFYHSVLGEDFFKINISVKRQSGEEDILPAIISEKLLTEEIKNSHFIILEGQIRTYNTPESKLEMYLFAKDIQVGVENQYINEVRLTGFLCKKGLSRLTYTNRKITNFILAVNRNFRKSDYIPVIAWGTNSTFIKNLDISTKLEVIGRFQSREYYKKNKNNAKNITYEISTSQIIISKE